MMNFTFYNPTRIIFGKGQIANLARYVPANSRVLITYGGGRVIETGTLSEVKEALKDFAVCEFGGILPNPQYEVLMKAVELARKEAIDFILAVGGGSVIDGTKFIAASIPFVDGDPWDILAKRAKIARAVPFGAVLTLPATGSEMNSSSIISREATQDKLAFMNEKVFPAFSILDPEKSFTLPKHQVSNGIIDIFVHVAEQYLTFPVHGKIQDRFAEGILLTLIEEGPKALKEPQNYVCHANLMWAATMGFNGLIGAGVPQDWATHMIGHEVTALHGLDHAQTLAAIYPAMLQVRRNEKREKLLQYAERVWNIRDGEDEKRIDQVIEKTQQFFESLNAHTRLSAYGIGKEAIPALLEQLKRHGMTALSEHRNLDLESSRKVLELAV
jgi:NADP-dependent alcohol dehydrogenase